jgi:levanase/fructan beta-fructosidase
MSVDGNPANTRWVLFGANGQYLVGRFDGVQFIPEGGMQVGDFGKNYYAAQTYSDIPASDARRILIAWMQGGQYPGMPFNQQMTFPRELALRTTPDGIRLCIVPVREIETIHAKEHAWEDQALKPGENLLAGLSGELFEIRAEIEPGAASEVGFSLRGQKVAYDVAKKQVTCLGRTAPLPLRDGRVQLHILLDRTTIEVFSGDGAISMPTCFLPDLVNRSLGVYAVGGEAKLRRLRVYELRSTWPAEEK